MLGQPGFGTTQARHYASAASALSPSVTSATATAGVCYHAPICGVALLAVWFSAQILRAIA